MLAGAMSIDNGPVAQRQLRMSTSDGGILRSSCSFLFLLHPAYEEFQILFLHLDLPSLSKGFSVHSAGTTRSEGVLGVASLARRGRIFISALSMNS